MAPSHLQNFVPADSPDGWEVATSSPIESGHFMWKCDIRFRPALFFSLGDTEWHSEESRAQEREKKRSRAELTL